MLKRVRDGLHNATITAARGGQDADGRKYFQWDFRVTDGFDKGTEVSRRLYYDSKMRRERLEDEFCKFGLGLIDTDRLIANGAPMIGDEIQVKAKTRLGKTGEWQEYRFMKVWPRSSGPTRVFDDPVFIRMYKRGDFNV